MHGQLQNQRLTSVDALRGFAMFLIIGGGEIIRSFCDANHTPLTQAILKQTNHVSWQGFSFWDLIMPLFMFIVGVAIPLSFAKRISTTQTRTFILAHIIKRVLILWLLGMIVQGNLLKYDLSQLQIYSNTLQAIAAGYLISSILILNFSIITQILTTASLLISFVIIIHFIPFADQPTGILEPTNNIARHIEKICAGRFFLETSTYTWFLSSINFTATIMLGSFAGFLLNNKTLTKYKKFLYLLIFAILLITAGLTLSIWHPIIKHIWTSSFTLYSAGLSCLLLAAFYLIIDIWNFKRSFFLLTVIGQNAIFAYVITRLFDFRHLTDIFIANLEKFTGPYHDLTRAAAAFMILWLILYWMYRKKTFIKV